MVSVCGEETNLRLLTKAYFEVSVRVEGCSSNNRIISNSFSDEMSVMAFMSYRHRCVLQSAVSIWCRLRNDLSEFDSVDLCAG